MQATKPSLPKGTRDFAPETMAKRNFILNTIREIFQQFGFLPLETPAMEKFDVLTGKYGEEGDKLLFRIFNAGELRNYQPEDYKEKGDAIVKKIADRALRYDLTVPFARFVVMNRNELTFPFKRYQIQPVWRGDSPQKGRYREFYQCDADVVGTESLICEAEIILMIHQTLHRLGIKDFTIKINNRKILAGIAEMMQATGKETDLCVAIDKLDKIGQEKVENELIERGFQQNAIETLRPLLQFQGSNTDKITFLEQFLQTSEVGKKGIAEIKEMTTILQHFSPKTNQPLEAYQTELDITLARGLSYYTGAIFEVKANQVAMGSISGGGRYDNLTGTFGMPNVSGVGFSFGVDRLYDVMEELQLFPKDTLTSTQLLFTNFDATAQQYALPLLYDCRQKGIKAEIFPEHSKLAKQMKYADAKKIPFVVLIGSDEMTSNLLTLKDMNTGEQSKKTWQEIVQLFSTLS
ncbi:MAG: histidine--tRNA ligase [Cytophagales bacterium]|nr:MAG: histidine--tRNA ligase [Cytophagales bacterium]